MQRIRLYQAAIAATLLGLTWTSAAQSVYRVVGADGKVTYSDKAAPTAASKGKVSSDAPPPATASSGAGLPYELKQVMSRFPVVLYTSAECAPCSSGRSLLMGRGIPFTEFSVTTSEDSALLKRSTGESMVPLLSVGGQRLKGYSQSEWTQTLDAAGYPVSSMLPPGYRFVAAKPLAPPVKLTQPITTENSEPAPAAPEPATSPTNPAGIRF